MACSCGGVISDIEYPCDTEGDIKGQANWELAHEEITEIISSYIQSIEAGTFQEWLKIYYGDSSYDVPEHQAVIANILSGGLIKHEKSVAECNECGRLWIQELPYKDNYLPYSPDNGKYNGICKIFKPENA